jgi:hypothetical protein
MRTLKQNTARNVLVFMSDATDHVTGLTGLTLTITASKAGAAFASITPTVTERANGWYQLALTASHTNTLGDFALHITGTGADPSDILMEVVSHDLSTIGKNAFVSTELAIGTVTSQTVFVLNGGPTNNIANVMAIIYDASDAAARVVAEGSYVGSTGTLTLTAATPITVTTSDAVTLVAVSAASTDVNVTQWGGTAVGSVTLPANVTQISGDSTAADNAESFFDGTGYAGTNNVIPTVTTVTNLTNLPSTPNSQLQAIFGKLPSRDYLAGTDSVDGDIDMNNVTGNFGGSVASVVGGINTGSGTITTLDALDTAQDTQHGTTQTALAGVKKVGERVRHTLNATNGTGVGAYDETT